MWFTARVRSAKRISCGRRKASWSPSTVPCVVQILEDRTLLSILSVTNALDKGAGSLRDAITHAQTGDTIAFDRSLNGQIITLTSDQLTINILEQ